MLTRKQLQSIRRLVRECEALTKSQRQQYSETETRTNFIGRLFEALGWKVYDRDEVERETTVMEGKRPDYIFKRGGIPRLFLEAKPFRDDIYDRDETKKAITKAYNKGVPWVGVTNFLRLVLYDAQEEITGTAQPARVLDLECGDYAAPDSLLRLLTPGAIDTKALEEHAIRIGVRRRAVPIEKRLYESMLGWRERLFNALQPIQNWRTDEKLREGDEAIQRLIDRLIFLRNCEDRGIGETDLRGLRNRIRSRERNVRVTESLLRLCARAATTYDSELFQVDALIDVLLRGMGTILDDTLAEIVEGLYSVPKSYAEYDFAQMDADVLGQVYEQYLGHVAQRVRKLAAQKPLPGMPAADIAVEAKRERRKQRGIFYTPRWVVHYIVQETLGRFLEENRNNDDAIDQLTILDPACGSGSFLIHAYETLLAHHADNMGGDVGHLDTRTRERILRRNIFGVDLDPQAVEIARLNLLVRMVRQQEQLPPLAENIQLGNSLISGGEAELRPYFGDGWREKQSFDWERRFPQVMARGGFDIIIGNPPYVRIQTLPRDEVAYYNERYEAATGNYDIYALFVERGLQLLRPGGVLGFIIPNKFMHTQYGKGLRKLLSDAKAVSKLVDFADAEVFESGTNYTCLLFLNREASPKVFYASAAQQLMRQPQRPNLAEAEDAGFDSSWGKLTERPWRFVAATGSRLLEKLAAGAPTLGQIAEKVFQGIVTSADKVYFVEKTQGLPDSGFRIRCRAKKKTYEVEPHLFHPLLKGSLHMRRYGLDPTKLLVLFPYHQQDGTYQLIPQALLEQRWPLTWQYLLDNRETLQDRERGKMHHDRWYAYVYPKNLDCFDKPKLLTPSIASNASFSYDAGGEYYFVGSGGGGGGGYGITLKPDVKASPLYVLGLLNSKLLDHYLHQISSPFRGGYWAYNRQYIAQLPVRLPDPASASDRQAHDALVALVDRMLDLHQRLAAKGGVRDSECEQIEREIARTDREIDDLVYDLYGLTAKERALVESELRR